MDRLPPGRQCAESDEDVRALAVFMEAIEQAHTMDRQSVRQRTTVDFGSRKIVDSVVKSLETVRSDDSLA